jgi:hypothetical protein
MDWLNALTAYPKVEPTQLEISNGSSGIRFRWRHAYIGGALGLVFLFCTYDQSWAIIQLMLLLTEGLTRLFLVSISFPHPALYLLISTLDLYLAHSTT